MRAFIILSLSFFLSWIAHGQAIPKFTAMVRGKEGGKISRGAFLAQEGVGGMRFIGGNHWEGISIDSFSIIVQRDSLVICKSHIIGQFFDYNLKISLSAIQKDDRIVIFRIYSHNYDGTIIFIRPIEFIIE